MLMERKLSSFFKDAIIGAGWEGSINPDVLTSLKTQEKRSNNCWITLETTRVLCRQAILFVRSLPQESKLLDVIFQSPWLALFGCDFSNDSMIRKVTHASLNSDTEFRYWCTEASLWKQYRIDHKYLAIPTHHFSGLQNAPLRWLSHPCSLRLTSSWLWYWFQDHYNLLAFISMSNPMTRSAATYINKDMHLWSDGKIRSFRLWIAFFFFHWQVIDVLQFPSLLTEGYSGRHVSLSFSCYNFLKWGIRIKRQSIAIQLQASLMKCNRNNLVLDFQLKSLRKKHFSEPLYLPQKKSEVFMPGSEPGRLHAFNEPHAQQEIPLGSTAQLFAESYCCRRVFVLLPSILQVHISTVLIIIVKYRWKDRDNYTFFKNVFKEKSVSEGI